MPMAPDRERVCPGSGKTDAPDRMTQIKKGTMP